MPKTLLQNVVTQLHRERNRLQLELHRVTAALSAFGQAYMNGAKATKVVQAGPRKRRRMSKDARARIAAAQRARWAKVKARKTRAAS